MAAKKEKQHEYFEQCYACGGSAYLLVSLPDYDLGLGWSQICHVCDGTGGWWMPIEEKSIDDKANEGQ